MCSMSEDEIVESIVNALAPALLPHAKGGVRRQRRTWQPMSSI